MKKLIVTTLCLVFAFTVLALSVSRASAQTDSAGTITRENRFSNDLSEDEIKQMIDEAKPLEMPLEMKEQKVDYYLAYPGILPDHFLYPIKMIRDRIWLFLTTNKIDKTKLLLLYADKRLGAAKALIEGGKKELGLETLTKSQQYLRRAATQFKDLDLDKECELGDQVYQSSLKHEEIMLELEERLDQEAQKLLRKNINNARQVQEEILPGL